MTKQRATYELALEVSPYGAVLEGVRGHPILGEVQTVHTSELLYYDAKTGEIETRNTIYTLHK